MVFSSSKVIAQSYDLVDFDAEDGGKTEAAFFDADANRVACVQATLVIFDLERSLEKIIALTCEAADAEFSELPGV